MTVVEKKGSSLSEVSPETREQWHAWRTAGIWGEGYYTLEPALTVAQRQCTLTWAQDDERRQKERQGAKRFCVGSAASFYKRICALPEPGRVYYELLRKGQPCHLYFDVDAEIAASADAEEALNESLAFGLELVQTLVEHFDAFFAHYIDDVLEGGAARLAALAGDSGEAAATAPLLEWHAATASTATKVSYHVVARVAGGRVMMRNNFSVGAAVRAFELHMRAEHADELRLPDGKGERKFIVDPCVYSRNRVWRALFCSKAGQRRYMYPLDNEGDPVDSVADGAATYDDYAEHFVGVPLAHTTHLLELPERSGTVAISRSSWLIDASDAGGRGARRSASAAASSSSVRMAALGAGHRQTPKLVRDLTDVAMRFVAEQHARHNGTTTHGAHAKMYHSDAGDAVLTIATNWLHCALRGGQHTSNRVHYDVNITRRRWRQWCFSPGCQLKCRQGQSHAWYDVPAPSAVEMCRVMDEHNKQFQVCFGDLYD
jgi:hypothetical protein